MTKGILLSDLDMLIGGGALVVLTMAFLLDRFEIKHGVAR
jgi:hypothetical protein